MPKNLILMRHAHYDKTKLGMPVSEDGYHQAMQAAQRMLEMGLSPDLMLYAERERTRQTANIVSTYTGEHKVKFNTIATAENSEVETHSLKWLEHEHDYEPAQTLKTMRDFPQEHSCICIVAHQPQVINLGKILLSSAKLANGSDVEDMLHEHSFHMSGFLSLEYQSDTWHALGQEIPRVHRSVAPHEKATCVDLKRDDAKRQILRAGLD